MPTEPAAHAPTRRLALGDIRDWVDIAFKTILAVAGIVIGYYFSFQKQQNDDIKLIVDLATAPESAKRLMGVSIAQTYQQQHRIPNEVYVAMISYANNTDDRGLQAAVNTGAREAAREQPALRQAISQALDALPVRVYFHIRDGADRDGAQKVKEVIESNAIDGGAIVVPGIELVPGAQKISLLKCFRKAECEKVGARLLQVFSDQGIAMVLSDRSSRYEKSTAIRPNHFEVWFAQGGVKPGP